MPRDWEANVGITGKAADLLWHGLAANTRRVYRAGQATYARFASSQGFKPFPVQFETLAQFIATSTEETSAETTKSYISHLRSYHIDKGYTTDIFNDERIKRILRGVARKYGNKPKRERLEITSEILQAILVTLRYTHDDVNIYAAFCTAFAGFLRIGEFTWSTWNNRSFLQSLSRESIQFVRDEVILKLPASETDPFRKGPSIPLSPLWDITCPVSTLHALVERHPRPAMAPLFSQLIGSFDRKWVLGKLRQTQPFAGINPAGFSGHSFRRGYHEDGQMEKRFCRSIFLANNYKQVVLPFNTTPCQAWASKHCVRFSAHTLSKFSQFTCICFGATQSLRLGTPLRREHQASPMSRYGSRANCPIKPSSHREWV